MTAEEFLQFERQRRKYAPLLDKLEKRENNLAASERQLAEAQELVNDDRRLLDLALQQFREAYNGTASNGPVENPSFYEGLGYEVESGTDDTAEVSLLDTANQGLDNH